MLLPALGALMPVTVNVALPVFVIVNTLVAGEPTTTSPNARLPLSPITRVVDGVGVDVVGEDEDPPHVERHMPRTKVARARFTRTSCGEHKQWADQTSIARVSSGRLYTDGQILSGHTQQLTSVAGFQGHVRRR